MTYQMRSDKYLGNVNHVVIEHMLNKLHLIKNNYDFYISGCFQESFNKAEFDLP